MCCLCHSQYGGERRGCCMIARVKQNHTKLLQVVIKSLLIIIDSPTTQPTQLCPPVVCRLSATDTCFSLSASSTSSNSSSSPLLSPLARLTLNLTSAGYVTLEAFAHQ